MDEPLAGAVDRTVAAGTVRLSLETRYDFTGSHPLLRRHGGLIGTRCRRTLGPGATVVPREGAIDFAGGRCALAGGRQASIVVGDREWIGRRGRPLARANQARRPRRDAALDLRPVPRDRGGERGRAGRRRRRRLARVRGRGRSHGRVSGAALQGRGAVPRGVCRGTQGMALDVAVDGAGRIRRVRTNVSRLGVDAVLKLHDFGVSLPPPFWGRLPAL